MTYTASADLPAGTAIRYSDCLLQTGGSGWTRSGSFDPATTGDALLIYQGLESSPSFIYGFGARANSWISSGAMTSNNSYLPQALADASPAAYATATNARNYRYTAAGSCGVYSTDFLNDLRNVATYWEKSGTSADAGSTLPKTEVLFDAERPYFNQIVRFSPSVSTTNETQLTFRITTNELVLLLSASAFTVSVTDSVSYGAVDTVMIDSSTYEVVVSGFTGQGSVAVSSFADSALLDACGNAALDTSFTGQSYQIYQDQDPIDTQDDDNTSPTTPSGKSDPVLSPPNTGVGM